MYIETVADFLRRNKKALDFFGRLRFTGCVICPMFCLQSTFCISQAGIFFVSLGLSFLNYSSRDLRQLLDSLEHWRGRVSGPQGTQLLGTGILCLPECLPYSFDVRVPRRTNNE